MTKEQRIIKEQTAQIADLTNEIKELKSKLETADEYRSKYSSELNDIHGTFDMLGIPKCVKNTYRDLTANARLTLFLAQMNGIRVEQPKDGD